MPAKHMPDRHFVGSIKLLVRAPSSMAAVELLKQRLSVEQSFELGQIVDYGFTFSTSDCRGWFKEKEISRDFLRLMESTRKDETQEEPPEEGSPRQLEMILRMDAYVREFDRL